MSQPYVIGQIHESMTGPGSTERGLRLLDGTRSLLWITGVRSEVLKADDGSFGSNEFFCHANLQFTGSRRQAVTASEFTAIPDGRLVTLIPGRLELRLPDGFGLPVYSDEALDYFSMALNLNQATGSPTVKFKTTITFHEDGGRSQDKRPLFRRALYAHEPTRATDLANHHGGHGQVVGPATDSPVPRSADPGRTLHWLIGPGTSENRTDVTPQLEISEETTVHFATAHLHPYARSVSLLDKSTGQVLMTIGSKDYETRRGVAEMELWSSTAGVPIRPDHQYELRTVYDNHTGRVIDAMSIVYLYLLDRRFLKHLGR